MKKIFVLTALCLITLLASAYNRGDHDYNYRYEEQQTIEQTFDVEALPNLIMEGKYSDFNITTWDRQQIDFKVKITVKSDKESTVKKLMEIIDVELSQSCNTVNAKTIFNNKSNKSYNASVSIKYVVRVPKDVLMNLTTRYGDITIDEVREKLKASIKYGDFKADNILIDDIVNNSIEVKYGNINIDNVKKMGLWLDYGDAKINTCDYIDGTLKYSKIFITDLNHCMLELKYSDARIEKADKVLFVNTAYSDMKVSNCTNLLSADMKYSNLKASMTSDSPIVDINGAYSDANLYLNEDASFNYSLRSSYGDITFKGFFDTSSIGGQGHYGEGERGSLNITTKYGDVDIRKNK